MRCLSNAEPEEEASDSTVSSRLSVTKLNVIDMS